MDLRHRRAVPAENRCGRTHRPSATARSSLAFECGAGPSFSDQHSENMAGVQRERSIRLMHTAGVIVDAVFGWLTGRLRCPGIRPEKSVACCDQYGSAMLGRSPDKEEESRDASGAIRR